MNKGRIRKHNIDIMFLMILFLIFTFSAVSVLLMSVNSYRAVVYANEENADTRTGIAYIREQVRQHDENGAVEIVDLDGVSAIRMTEEEGYYLYIYSLEDHLMELEAKEGSGVTADFGNKILEIGSLDFQWAGEGLLKITLEDKNGNTQLVDIAVKSAEALAEEVSADEE